MATMVESAPSGAGVAEAAPPGAVAADAVAVAPDAAGPAAGASGDVPPTPAAARLFALMLVSGSRGLVALVGAVRAALRAALRALRALGAPLAAPALLAAALRAVLTSAPVQLILRAAAQLASLQLAVGADNLRESGARLSGHVTTRLALLFGMIRLRTHTSLQLAAPSLQPRSLPHCSDTARPGTPAAGETPGGSPATGRWTRHAVLQLPWSRPLAASPPHQQRSPALPQLASAHSPQTPWVGGGGALGASCEEVHLLCSSELKSAILGFLQAQRATGGPSPGYVVLAPPGGSGGAATGSAHHLRGPRAVPPLRLEHGGSDTPPQRAPTPSASSDSPRPADGGSSPLRSGWRPGAHDADASPSSIVCSGPSVRMSCELFEGLATARESAALAAARSGEAGSESQSPRPSVTSARSGAPPPPQQAPQQQQHHQQQQQQQQQQPQQRAPPLGAASAANLYACAAPAGRISPMARPAKHGMNPHHRASGGAISSSGSGPAGGIPLAASSGGSRGARKPLPPAPFSASSAGGPTDAPGSWRSPPEASSGGGLRSLLGDDLPAPLHGGPVFAARRSLIGTP